MYGGRRSEKYDRYEVENYGVRVGKVSVPYFHGGNDPRVYLEWEKKVEHSFQNQCYSEAEKVRRACSKFIGEALTWWNKVVLNRKKCYSDPIVTWGEMRRVMRKQFSPSHYDRRVGGREETDSRDAYSAYLWGSTRREKSLVTPTRSSAHGYRGTSQFSNNHISDVRCLWCLGVGHDITHCPIEDMTVVDSKSKIKNQDFVSPLISDLSIECSAVEGDLLDDMEIAPMCVIEEDNRPTSSDLQCISFTQLDSNVILDEQLTCYELSEKEIDMAERKSDEKSEMAKLEKKEWKENEGKEAKEKELNLKAQASEVERALIVYKPLRVHLYNEGLSYYNDIAGSIPSTVKLHLQDLTGSQLDEIFQLYNSYCNQGNEDLRTNLFEEGENDAILISHHLLREPCSRGGQDLRTNLFEERENDTNLIRLDTLKEPRPRGRMKNLKFALQSIKKNLNSRLKGFGIHHNQVGVEEEECKVRDSASRAAAVTFHRTCASCGEGRQRAGHLAQVR